MFEIERSPSAGSHVVVQLGALDVAGHAVVEPIVVVVDVKVGKVVAQASGLVSNAVRLCGIITKI